MKTKLVFILGCLLTGSSFTNAQSRSDIFDRDVSITWLGLDFTEAKFLGDRERYGSSSDVKFLIKSWNDLIDKERKKYDPARATRKKKADYQIDIARNHNEDLDVSEMLSNDKNDYLHLKEEDITSIVNTYDFKGLSGVGMIFVVEGFNKLQSEASIWVTFINLGTKEVLLTERIQAPPSGTSLRNYWGGSVSHVMEKMEGKQMEIWRKKFSH